jgi:hypothetical protein
MKFSVWGSARLARCTKSSGAKTSENYELPSGTRQAREREKNYFATNTSASSACQLQALRVEKLKPKPTGRDETEIEFSRKSEKFFTSSKKAREKPEKFAFSRSESATLSRQTKYEKNAIALPAGRVSANLTNRFRGKAAELRLAHDCDQIR